MLFIELNDGTRQNLATISYIEVKGTDVIYKPGKQSIFDIIEHFGTEQEAQDRYTELQDKLLVNISE